MMKSYRGNAIAVGVLFIACSVASILSVIPLGSTLDDADYLSELGGLDTSVVMTSLIEFIWAATGAGIAIGLYPILRTYSRALALGSVAARVVEGVFVLIGTLALLALLTVSQQSLAAGPSAQPSFQPVGDALIAVRDWAHGFVAILALAIGALLYYFVLYTADSFPDGCRVGASLAQPSCWSPRSWPDWRRTSASPRRTPCSTSPSGSRRWSWPCG